MQSRSSTRFALIAALLVLVAGVFGYVAGSAPAGNRDPNTFDFNADPGPSSITFGQPVAYKAQYSNTGKSNWVKVVLGQSVPYANITTPTGPTKLFAKLVYSSCEPNPSAPPDTTGKTTYSCPEVASLPAGSGLKKFTFVWESRLLPADATCDSPCQLTTTGTLNIKEGNTGTNDSFSKGPILTGLFAVPDKDNAGGYPIKACTDTSNPTLVTNLAIGTGNPMSTKVCEPVLPANVNGLDPGLATTILERGPQSGETNGTTPVSVICIAAVGLTCPNTSATAFEFPSDQLATFEFVYDRGALGKITQMFDNNVLVSSDPTVIPNCQITYDRVTGVQASIATCHAKKNGPWRGG